MKLKQRAFSAVRWTTSVAVVRILLQLIQIAFLARLLEPEDFGLMAMVALVLGFANVFADFGLNSAYVQRQVVTPEERSSLFWLNVAMGGALTSLVLVFSPMIASFFDESRLVPLLMLASIIFVVNALGQQVKITAEKNLEFRPVAVVEIVASVAAFVTAITAAFAGWGVYSLIVGAILNALAGTLLAWLVLSRSWRPMWGFQWNDIRSFMGFGGSLVANNIVNEVNRNVDLLLGGRMLLTSALGFYSLPRQFVFHVQQAVNPIVTRVGFPLIAQVQTDIPKVRYIYLKTLNMTSSINAPIYVGIAFFAPEVVSIVFGDKWLEAVDVLRLLSVWGFIRSSGNPVGGLLLGMGRADLALKWNLSMLFVVAPLLWIGSFYGTLGLAWSLLGLSVITFVPSWYILVRSLCHAGLLEYCVAVFRPLLIAVMSIMPVYFITLPMINVLGHMAVGSILSVFFYVGFSYFLNREWFISLRQLLFLGR